MDPQLNEHQAKIKALTKLVWSSEEDAQRFLNTPHQLMGGNTPLAVAATEEGARQIEKILNNLYWGLPC